MRYKISRRQPTAFKQLALYLSGVGKAKDQSKAHSADRVLWMEARNLHTDDPCAAAAIMGASSRVQPNRCQKPAYHFILAFDPDDDKAGKVNPEMMKEIADKAIDRLELQDHQALIYAHQDKDHPHIHFLVNRIHPETGKAWNRHNDGRRLLEFCGEMAVEHGLNMPRNCDLENDKEQSRHLERVKHICPENEFEPDQLVDTFDRGSSLTEARGIDRKTDPRKLYPMARIDVQNHDERLTAAFQEARSWNDIVNAAEREGLEFVRKGQGLVLSNGKEAMKLSAMGRDYSMGKLEMRFGQLFDDWRRERAIDIMSNTQTSGSRSENRKNSAIEIARRANVAIQEMSFVVEELCQSEQHIQNQAGRSDKVNRGLFRQEQFEASHEEDFVNCLAKTYRDPLEAFRKWNDLGKSRGEDHAAAFVGARPDILGSLRGTEIAGRKSADRRAAERSFQFLTQRRQRWQKAIGETCQLREAITKQHMLLDKARNDHERLLSAMGSEAEIVRIIRNRIADRIIALSRLTPAMIQKADLSDRHREQLERAAQNHENRRQAKAKERKREREGQLKQSS